MKFIFEFFYSFGPNRTRKIIRRQRHPPAASTLCRPCRCMVHDWLLCRRPRGHFGIARSVRLSVCPMAQLPRLQARWLPAAKPPPATAEMCRLRTRPRTDVVPPRFLPPSNCHRRWAYRLAATVAIPYSLVENTRLSRSWPPFLMVFPLSTTWGRGW